MAMPPARLGAFLRIAPSAYERDFWRSSHHRKMAASLDLWTLWFTFSNCVLLLRYVNIAEGLLVEGTALRIWCISYMVFAAAQAACRHWAPSKYGRWRLYFILFSRLLRLGSFLHLLHIRRAAFTDPGKLAAQQRRIYLLGPVRALLFASQALSAFVTSCNTILPFLPQAAFQLAYTSLCLAVNSRSTALLLSSASARAPPPPALLLQRLAPPPPGFHDGIQQLCASLNDVMQTVTGGPDPPASHPAHTPCQEHAVEVLSLFLTLLLVLIVPTFIAYRIEQHTKCLYLMDLHHAPALSGAGPHHLPDLRGLQPLPTLAGAGPHPPDPLAGAVVPVPPDTDADVDAPAPCLPDWADLVSLGLLTFTAWEAAMQLHGAASLLQI